MSTTMLNPAPPPTTELERYRLLSTTAGVRVSPLCLGAMSIGEAWANEMGSMGKEQSFAFLDAFREAGGNFIDSANNYQDEQSETYIGEWMESRGNRDEIFLATKYTTSYRSWDLGKGKRVANYNGNSKKAMFVSLEDSLRKLKTSYLDLFYVHYWDWTSGIEEVMDALHILVQQGKVLYLGISNTPAWIVAAANTYARAQGKTPFSVYQGRWNVMLRDLERDIIPMARTFGMAICPWDVLGSGKFKSRAQVEARKAAGETLRSSITSDLKFTFDMNEQQVRMSDALEKVAGEHGEDVTVQQIALAYVRSKTYNVFPIVGGRKIEQLHDNIKALSIRLTEEQIKYLEGVNEFQPGYPHDLFGDDPRTSDQPNFIITSFIHLDFPRFGKTLRDH
jgi:aryl-alcohol dehydrogenase-like predicted oxidoreductase